MNGSSSSFRQRVTTVTRSGIHQLGPPLLRGTALSWRSVVIGAAGRSSGPEQRVLVEREGTGAPVGNVAIGAPGLKGRIEFGEVIGPFSEHGTGDLVPTSADHLHHGSLGVLIVPARPAG